MHKLDMEYLINLQRKAVALEREACVQLAKEQAERERGLGFTDACYEVAELIHARGDGQEQQSKVGGR